MIIESLIRVIKNDPQYKWESVYSFQELFAILVERAAQVIRGLPLRFLVKHSDGIIFKGRNVIIRHKHSFSAGRNLILDDYVHINALSANGVVLGDNVTIGRNSVFACTGVISQKGVGITIGNGVGINARAFFGGQGGIRIGDNVIIGPDVKIFSENHNFRGADMPIKKQGVSRKGVYIKENCWIGSGVTIVDGVTIGEGCVIAAGSVVTKSLSDNVIAAGIPAKVIGNRILPITEYKRAAEFRI